MAALRTVTRTQGANADLKTGAVRPVGVELEFVEVQPLVSAFTRMVRDLEFDVCEMAVTTYLTAREHGGGFTALPAFLVRGLHHDAIVVNRRSGITSAGDLEGRVVGVGRGYTVTRGVWAREILASEHGVDLSRITWLRSAEEHVRGVELPSNVRMIEPGKRIEDLLAEGSIDAAVNVTVDHPDVVPLLPHADEAGFRSLEDTGLWPLNHLVVIRDDLLAARPELAGAVYQAFVVAKDRYLERLRAGDVRTPQDALLGRISGIDGRDPLPYGVEANRPMLDRLVRAARDQGILRRAPEVDALFAAGVE